MRNLSLIAALLLAVLACPALALDLQALRSYAFVASRSAGEVTVLDMRDASVAGEVVLRRPAYQLAVREDRKELVVGSLEDSRVAVIDLATMHEEDLQRQLDDKLFGFLGMIRAVLPFMRRQGDGRIVDIIGQATRHPHPDRLPSGIANAAASAMTKAVADAVARENIRVNAVCPQYVETRIIGNVIAKEMRDRGVDRETAAAGFTRANVLGRLGLPEEIADLVAYLVSDRAGFVTGSSVSIDGGYGRYVFG